MPTRHRVLIYEFVTGGGWWSVSRTDGPRGSLFKEGAAMVGALAEDFTELEGVRVDCLLDARIVSPFETPNSRFIFSRRGITQECDNKFECHSVDSSEQERELLCGLASRADHTVVIAPEFEGHLLRRVQWLEEIGARLLSPNSTFVALTADKQATAERLHAARVPVPRGVIWRGNESFPVSMSLPWVIKPRDGAGSSDVRRLTDLARIPHGFFSRDSREWRVEEFCPGQAASVAILCGSGEPVVLPASRQLFADEQGFDYVGGETPLTDDLCRRASRLAIQTIRALPPAMGYFGIDLVLGNCPEGSQDFVIEVNPRLTTSYIGLRQIVRENLAGAMMRVARGEPVELLYSTQPVRFSPDDTPCEPPHIGVR